MSGREWRRTFRLEPFGGGLDDALDEELSFHLEERIHQLMADGLDKTEARAQAERELGRLEEHRRRSREADRRRARVFRRRAGLDSFALDLRQILRGLRRTPGFTLMAGLLIAVSIGAGTTIFSITEQVLIEPLPFTEPDRLLRIWERSEPRGIRQASLSGPTFIDLRDRNRSFEGFGAYTAGNMVLTGEGDPLQLRAGRVSAGFFRTLDVQPELGRLFSWDEDADGAPAEVVLLSHRLWRSRFGERSDIVGRSLTIDGRPFTVVGVLPAGEFYLDGYDLWVPLGADPGGPRNNHILWAIGRLRAGVTFAEAQSELDALAVQIADENAMPDELTGVTLIPLTRVLIGDRSRTTMGFLMAAVGLLLLIACANLASLLLALGTLRRRELAISAALGAGRLRLTRQLLTESLLLALVGGGLGVLLSLGLVALVKTLGPGVVPRVAGAGLDPGVLLFALGMMILVALFSGLAPAAVTPVVRLNEVLQEGGRSGPGRGRDRFRALMVMGEIVLTTVLLIGSGLMIRSLLAVQGTERGFEVEGRLLFDVTLPESRYQEEEPRRRLLDDLVAGIEAIPGVRGAGAVSASPLDGLSTDMWILREGQVLGPDERLPLADWRYITPGYLRSLGLPLLRGRVFTDLSETEAAPLIDRENERREVNVVISESVAEMLWPGEEPIGRRTHLWAEPNTIGVVIGVVEDMRERGLEDDLSRAVYLSYAIGLWNPVTFVVDAGRDPERIVPTVRGILAGIDPDLPISNVRRLDELLDATMGPRRFNTLLLVFFAAIALLLACSGIYGIVAQAVTERRREIAVRLVLGSVPTRVLELFLRQVLTRILPAVLVGLVAAFAVGRAIESMLFGVTSLDVTTYVGVSVVLLSVAVLAVVVPAWRATRVEPVSALRQE